MRTVPVPANVAKAVYWAKWLPITLEMPRFYFDCLGVVVLSMAMKEIDLLQGTLDLLVLKTLGAGPMHGYRIASKISSRRTYCALNVPIRIWARVKAVFTGGAIDRDIDEVFGIMAHAVMQRRNEIGIRIALGAPAANVFRLVLRHGLLLVTMGLGFGVAAALVITRVIQTFLWGITPTDPVTFMVVTVALAALALVACYVPARRALRIDPIIALRIE